MHKSVPAALFKIAKQWRQSMYLCVYEQKEMNCSASLQWSNEREQASDSGSNTNLKNMLSEKKPDLRMHTA